LLWHELVEARRVVRVADDVGGVSGDPEKRGGPSSRRTGVVL
jgi:hypothetical protein